MKHWFSDVSLFRRDAISLFMEKGCNAQDTLVRLHLGPQPIFLVTDAAVVKSLLKASEKIIDKGRLVRKLRTVIGTSSITMSGPEHQKRRAAIHQHLARGIMQNFVPEIVSMIRRHAALLVSEKEFDAHGVMAPLALRIITTLLFGRDVLSPADEAALVQAVYTAEAEMSDTLFRIFPRSPWVALRKRRELAQSRAIMAAVVERVQARATSTSMLNALKDLNLTPEELRDEVLLLLLAGHHTTGNAAAWLLYFLATQPGLAEKIREEAAAITTDAGEIDPVRLPRSCTSLNAARETLRLYPPFYWFSREIMSDITVAGRSLAKGTILIVSPYQIQRDPRFWDDPDTFNVERSYNNAFLPFGLGPRACVGIGLGLLELQLLALEVASAFDVTLLSELPLPAPSPNVTLLPPPIRLRLVPRAGAVPTPFSPNPQKIKRTLEPVAERV